MPISYVGAGTYAACNNASVVPGIPAGVVAGDLLVLIATLREDTNSLINTPAGWTLANQGIVAGSTPVEMRIGVFYRAFAAGVTAPTVSFTGGGSNDATQALILAFRGASVDAGAVAIQFNSFGYNLGLSGSSYFDENIDAGDYLLAISGGTTTTTATAGIIEQRVSGVNTTVPSTFLVNSTALGADSSLALLFGAATVTYVSSSSNAMRHSWTLPASYTLTNYSSASFYIKQGAATTVYSHTGTGGLKFYGLATASKPTTSLYTGSGGLRLSGAATAGTRNPIVSFSGSGGLSVRGGAVVIGPPPIQERKYLGPEIVFSGGNGNTFSVTSLGGLPSLAVSGAVSSQLVQVSLPGVDVRSGTGLSIGTGSLTYLAVINPGVLTFTEPNGSKYSSLIGGDGLYRLGGLLVKITSSQLPTTGQVEVPISISNPPGRILDDVEYSSRLSGDIDYRCFYISNQSGLTHTCSLIVDTDPTYSDVFVGTEFGLSVGVSTPLVESAGAWWHGGTCLRSTEDVNLDAIGVFYSYGAFAPITGVYYPPQVCDGTTGGALQLINETTPASVFSSIEWATSLDFGAIPPGQYRSFWIKRVVPMDSGLGVINDLARIKVLYGD